MRVAVVGAGLMGAQIGCEYALGGHEVTLVARNGHAALERAEAGLRLMEELGLAAPAAIDEARGRISVGLDAGGIGPCDLAVESLPENLQLKAEVLAPVARSSPEAILATNTSSLSVTELGAQLRAPERTLGTHYWNPPLLMPVVEVIPSERCEPQVVSTMVATLRELGKQPVLARDVPGFVWNRLQIAVLREAAWIVENGVASPETVDEILTDGLARRWRNVGFFRSIALGGVATWERTAANLLPELSAETALADLDRWLESDESVLADAAARRDEGLARDLLRDRKGPADG
jgi:3-hydroxybutyryl-CoA dehydrogenase